MSNVVREIGAVILAVLIVTAICLNCLLCTVLWRSPKGIRCRQFVVIAWQMLTCDLLSLFNQAVLALPSTICQQPVYNFTVNFSICLLDRFSFYGSLLFALLLTLNRVTVFMFPRVNQEVFSDDRIVYPIATVWSVMVAYMLGTTLGGCYNYFDDKKQFVYTQICDPSASPFAVQILEPLRVNTAMYAPRLMLLLYVVLFVFLKIQRRGVVSAASGPQQSQRRGQLRLEIRMLIQSIIIAAVLEIYNLIFFFLRNLFSSESTSMIMDVLCAHIMAITTLTNALIIFTFNASIRKQALELVTGQRKQAVEISVNTRATTYPVKRR